MSEYRFLPGRRSYLRYSEAHEAPHAPYLPETVADPKIVKIAGRRTICQLCIHLSQMHPTNYMPFTQKKAAF